MSETAPHPLDGTFAYFDSELEIEVGPPTTYKLHGNEYIGRFTFTGHYSVLLETGERYYWPVLGGTINELHIGGNIQQCGYEIAFVMFSPNVRKNDPTHGDIDLSRFVDAWTGYAGVDADGRVNRIELRFVNVTFHPETHHGDKIGHSPAGHRASGRPRIFNPGHTLEPVRTAWSAFSWQPTWEDFGARGYTRKP